MAKKSFSHAKWAELVEETNQMVKKLSSLKGGEYAGDDDRLLNFRRNAEALGLNMEQVWAVYAAKHWDAIMQYVKDMATGKKRERLEGIEGRADDLIVYLILFKAMVIEASNEKEVEPKSDWSGIVKPPLYYPPGCRGISGELGGEIVPLEQSSK